MKPSPKLVVFITGAFLSNDCWNEWQLFFWERGYSCIAPSWPHKEASSEQLRNRHPDVRIASTRLISLLDHFGSIIDNLPEKPILIGHSLGGLIVQLLLQRELGVAGVAMHSFPPKGVGKDFTFLKGLWQAMGFFTSADKTYLMSFKKWKLIIASGMSCRQQKELYYQYAIPESKRLIGDIFTSIAKINFRKAHPPLLLTAGGEDKLIPASLNYRNYQKYQKGVSVTHYKEFKERSHLVFGVPGWTEDAQFIVDWLGEISV